MIRRFRTGTVEQKLLGGSGRLGQNQIQKPCDLGCGPSSSLPLARLFGGPGVRHQLRNQRAPFMLFSIVWASISTASSGSANEGDSLGSWDGQAQAGRREARAASCEARWAHNERITHARSRRAWPQMCAALFSSPPNTPNVEHAHPRGAGGVLLAHAQTSAGGACR